VILLSATLTHETKEKLMLPYGGSSSNRDYPLVTHVSSAGEVTEFPLLASVTKRVVKVTQWHAVDLMPDRTQQTQLIQWAKAGAMVAVICNTVLDAQILYAQLMSIGDIEVDLFHARFTTQDRMDREQFVLNKYGKHAPRKGGLLIASQVVEQSLDLDFDVIISQLAPIEFVIQRMGRLWRHDRNEDNESNLVKRSSVIETP
jgi:CRISPR-associated endonuclease/helicase Cas3